jgi:alcohol dehydrogenase class IV
MTFDFATAGRILFGPGRIGEAPSAARQMGSRALLVHGCSSEQAAALARELEAAGVSCLSHAVCGEPTVDAARQVSALACAERCDLIVAFGGGSAIDLGKAVAALAANGGDPLDYLEVVGAGRPLAKPSLPCIAIPTTAGTGAEVTRNAVLASPEHKVKASLRSPYMLPRLAIVDPDATLSLPPAVTASTGLDALTQLIEPYVSSRANVLTDLFAVEGMRQAAACLRRAYQDGSDREARCGMAFASLLGGLCLANSGLGAVHGFAAPIGGMFDAPHGAVCAALLPYVMEANIQAAHQRGAAEVIRRYAQVACLLTGNSDSAPEDGVAWVHETCTLLNIPRLGEWGLTAAHVPEVAAKASQASSMKGNPLPLSNAELMGILEAAL